MLQFTYLQVRVGPPQHEVPTEPDSPTADRAEPVTIVDTLARQGWEIVSDTVPALPRDLVLRKAV